MSGVTENDLTLDLALRVLLVGRVVFLRDTHPAPLYMRQSCGKKPDFDVPDGALFCLPACTGLAQVYSTMLLLPMSPNRLLCIQLTAESNCNAIEISSMDLTNETSLDQMDTYVPDACSWYVVAGLSERSAV